MCSREVTLILRQSCPIDRSKKIKEGGAKRVSDRLGGIMPRQRENQKTNDSNDREDVLNARERAKIYASGKTSACKNSDKQPEKPS